MNSIKSYIILNKKINIYIKRFKMITILILITMIILCQIKYKSYYFTTAQVIKNDNYYQLLVLIPEDELSIIKENNNLIIEDIIYDYKIINIDNDYVLTNNNKLYLKVVLSIGLRKKDMIVNNLLQVKILKSNKKIFYYIKDYFVKGVKI